MKSGQPLRIELAALSRHLHERGWVANHDGNVTARDGARFVGTPTATSKRLVQPRDLIEVDARGQVVGGRGRAFGELGLHLAVYERRPDVGCVVHAHPPHATAISAAPGNPIEQPFIAEAVVSLGPRIPKLPFAAPGDPARAALAPWCELVDAVILGNHGVLAWGADPEQALLRLELVEHLARIAVAAAPLGGVQPLPASCLPALYAARAKAGLGRAGDRAVQLAAQLAGSASPPAVIACAPAPHANVSVIEPPRRSEGRSSPSSASSADIAAVVRDEVVRALRGS